MEQHPDFFRAAVLSSPMIAPNIGGFPPFLASAVAACAGLLGKRKNNPFFMKPYSGPEDFESSCATDPKRFAWYDEIKASRTDFQNSVPSYGWSNESIHVTGKILAPGAPEKITCPILLFTADKDSSVMPDPQRQFISRISNGKQVFVKNSRHEIFRSTNDVLFPWWHEVIGFYHQHNGGQE
jgi:lysophospholipase